MRRLSAGCEGETLGNFGTEGRFYRSLRAVKVLLATLRSTLTVLAPRGGRSLSVAFEELLLVPK